MANVQLDFQILDPEDEGLQMSVLLVAAKRELVDQRMALLRDAGVKTTVVDVDAFALSNAFEYNYPDASRGAVALVNVGHELSTVILKHDGAPVLTRDIPFGSRHLREDLRRMHGLGADEAEAVLAGRSDRAVELEPLLAERMRDLVMGIERAVAFASGDGDLGRGLGSLFLAGGAAQIPRLGDVIAEQLRVRVEVANPLQRLRIHPGATMQIPSEELAPMLMLPVGLALRGAA